MPPLSLPNALIYLTSLFRPSILRPDLRVPSIAHVDFRALRRAGVNAVVIDKDNCLTIPYEDGVYPPYQTAWNDLVETFRPGRVLVVSNSAGTQKDPGGIAAEALSLSLRAPVLLHSQPKPGCSPSILSYFHGTLGKPTTRRHEIVAESLAVREEERADELALVEKWKDDVEEPLLGPLKSVDGKILKHGAHGEGKKSNVVPPKQSERSTTEDEEKFEEDGPLRIAVIGDRLFTDTLLAHRLSRYLPPSTPKTSLPPVISIDTTALPEPKDVRALRWIEDKLTRGQLKSNADLLQRFILPSDEASPATSDPTAKPQLGFVARRLGPLRWLTPSRWREIHVTPLTWNPRSWRLLSLIVGFGRLTGRTGTIIYRGTRRGTKYVWTRGKTWAEERKGKAENAVAVAPPTAREGQLM